MPLISEDTPIIWPAALVTMPLAKYLTHWPLRSPISWRSEGV